MFIIEVAECDACDNKNLECFRWFDRKNGKPRLVSTECYECDMDTDPRGESCLEDIAKWAEQS